MVNDEGLSDRILAALATRWDAHERMGSDSSLSVEAMAAHFSVPAETINAALEELKWDQWITPAAGAEDPEGRYQQEDEHSPKVWWDGSAYVISDFGRHVASTGRYLRRHWRPD